MTDAMDSDDIFNDAIEIESPEEREKFLDEKCAGNAALRAEVLDLLDWAPRVKPDFLGKMAAGPDLKLIGPYTLKERLGEGGMGTVYLAEQHEPVRRQVALKIVQNTHQFGAQAEEYLARFEAERQALARMDHPNIAKVYDAGTTPDKHPYFAMELVQGSHITAYCDQMGLSVRERLALFAPICKAIQHAHNKGVIHRDIKPSNVLVAVHDGAPIPKVIDFGIAKAIGQKLSEHAKTTQSGQAIGTPGYMSPEQASGLDVDARSDIYALGALLYELLAGATPLHAEIAAAQSVPAKLQVICDVEPLKPSARIAEAKEELPLLAGRRKTAPKQLVRQVRGDLDCIAMKALEKDRARRYESAADLAQDIERHLRNEPIEASPPGTAYRLSKFVRRNKVVVSAVTAVALAVVAGLIVSTWMYFKERDALIESRNNEGISWVERAKFKTQEHDGFAAALMAARATGFHGYGRPEGDNSFNERFPELLHPNTQFAADAVRLADQAVGGKPIWFSPRVIGEVSSICFSPDGMTVATGNGWGVQLWDVATGRKRAGLVWHSAAVHCLCFSPDGVTLAAGCDDNTVRLWNMSTEKESGTPLQGHSNAVTSVSFSPDGSMLASASYDNTVVIWNMPGEFKVPFW